MRQNGASFVTVLSNFASCTLCFKQRLSASATLDSYLVENAAILIHEISLSIVKYEVHLVLRLMYRARIMMVHRIVWLTIQFSSHIVSKQHCKPIIN